jgi:hypothetical protein
MMYFDKQFEKGLNGVNHKAQYAHVVTQRNQFNAGNASFVQNNKVVTGFVGNASAIIPQDVYREFDRQPKVLARADNLVLLNDLMAFGRSLPVGKIEYTYRKTGDAGVVKTSITGQVPTELDKTPYSYASAIKVMHDAGFGRGWMEMEGQRTEAFDGLIDDNANVTRNVLTSLANHVYNGVGETFNGTAAVGIKNSTAVQSVDLDASDLNVDFTTAAGSAARTGFIKLVDKLRITNNASGKITFYVSREIGSNFQNHYNANDVGYGTILEDLKKLSGVADIKEDASLSGNEVVGVILDSQYIQLLSGMAVNTVPMFRGNPRDNYNFMVSANAGLVIRTDYAGQKGVLYARNIS